MDDALPTQPTDGPPPPSAASRSFATVLLVDDRSYDRRRIVEALRAARLAAPTLPNGVRALAACERQTEALDALVCATAMPGCLDFVRAAAGLRPALAFVLIEAEGVPAGAAAEHLDRMGRRHRVLSNATPASEIAAAAAELVGRPADRAAA